MRLPAHLCCLIALAAGCRCEVITQTPLEPIRVASQLSFPDTWVGASSEQTLALVNAGRAPRTVKLQAVTPFLGPSEVALGGGEEAQVTLTFSPSTAGPASAVLLVEDGVRTQEVTLAGTGLEVPDCGAPTACRQPVFDFTSGSCVERLAPDGADCTASLSCFVRAQCFAGECRGSAVTCADDNPCTLDVCSEVGCGHVDGTPFCPTSPNPCLVPTCSLDAGCGFVEALDGTACGERTCTTALVCVSGACVTRTPPRNQACADLLVGVPAGTGSADGRGDAARFSSLRSIAVQEDGALVVDGTRLRRVRRDGLVSTVAGNISEAGDLDGVGLAARIRTGFVAPTQTPGLFLLTQGPTVRLASMTGLVTTLAGTVDGGGLVDGVGAAARLMVGSQPVLTPSGRARFLQFEPISLLPPRLSVRELSLQGAVRTLAQLDTSTFPGFDPTKRWRSSGFVVDTGDDSVEVVINLAELAGSGSRHWTVSVSPDAGASASLSPDFLMQSWRRGTASTLLEPCSVVFPSDAGAVRVAVGCVASGALDRDGGVWTAGEARVQLVSAAGRRTLAGPDPDRRVVDGARDGGRVVWPRSLALTPAGSFFLDGPEANGGPMRVRRLSAAGLLETVDAGFTDLVSVVALGAQVLAVSPAGRATFIDPTTLAVEGVAPLAASPLGVVSNGLELRGVSTTVPVLTLDGGATPSALFTIVHDLAPTPSGTWVVAGEHDPAATGALRLFELDSAGNVSLLAGAPAGDAEVDGPALQAQLGGLDRVAVAPDGTIYFSSARTNRIRRLRAGQVSTLIELTDQVIDLAVLPDGSLLVSVDAALLRVLP